MTTPTNAAVERFERDLADPNFYVFRIMRSELESLLAERRRLREALEIYEHSYCNGVYNGAIAKTALGSAE